MEFNSSTKKGGKKFSALVGWTQFVDKLAHTQHFDDQGFVSLVCIAWFVVQAYDAHMRQRHYNYFGDTCHTRWIALQKATRCWYRFVCMVGGLWIAHDITGCIVGEK